MRRPRSRTARTLRPVQDNAGTPLPTLTLAEVLEEALIWQPEAEEVIARCVATGGKTADLAQQTAMVGTAYLRLLDVTRTLPRSPQQQEAAQLLIFHHRLVHEALRLGFHPDSPAREKVAAHFRGGLAGPGRRLVALHEQVAVAPLARPRPVTGDADVTLDFGLLSDPDRGERS